jgi:calcium/calmodulin-dependent protein kinase (CaM kinase) II
VLVAKSLEQAVERAGLDDQPFVIGGGEIFVQALPLADRLLVTWVEAEVEGDVRFPEWDRADWRLAEQEHHSADVKNQYDYTFAAYERRPRHASLPQSPGSRPPLRFRLASSPPSKVTIMPSELAKQLLDLNQKLLVAIVAGDWKTYESLCDESITCFEPEARGQVVVGMPFHKYYFDLPAAPQKPGKNVTMTQPHVRLIGESAAVLSYVRLTQSLGADGAPQTSRVEETRVWQKIGSQWKHVHFHRSGNA